MLDLESARRHMREHDIDAWLVYDFRGHNPVFREVLGATANTTRRSFLFVSHAGDRELFAHALDHGQVNGLGVPVVMYRTWRELQDLLRARVEKCRVVAMEYSSGGELPTMAWVDAGTRDLIEEMGPRVVSSADLFQVAAATWTPAAFASHQRASEAVLEIKDFVFAHIREALERGRSVTEYMIQQLILVEFARREMVTQHLPVVATNSRGSDPHYQPSEGRSAAIGGGDWVLIDLWARERGDDAVFADVTWVGYAGTNVPAKQREVFDVVKRARDAVVGRLHEAWRSGEVLQGWQLDRVARDLVGEAGYEEYFIHRTGHSIGPGGNVHALGVNLDDYETHDTRSVLPGIGFTVEPGVYLPEFGVRLEINIFMDPARGPTVTTTPQQEVVSLA